MALPKISVPTFTIKVPSTGKDLRFRPFLVKEEKILLLAQTGDSNDEMGALIQIINNCCFDDLDVDKLTTFDVEYIFLKLRAKSVNNIVNLKYRDNEDNEIYEFDVNLDEIEMKVDPNVTNKIDINDEIKMIMKYPNIKIAQNLGNVKNENELLNKILIHCIDNIYDAENIYPANEVSEEELVDFLENLDTKTFKKIEDFFTNMPKIYHELNYKNKMGNDRTIKLESIQDFFT